MRSTAVWLSLLLCSLSISAQTVEAQRECRIAPVCGAGELDFCCLATERWVVADGPTHQSDDESGLATNPDVSRTCHSALQQALPHKEWEIPDGESTDIGVIIASLPSPFRTGTASLFDPALEGVVAALSDEGFIRDRSWLWDVSEREQGEGDNEGKQDSALALAPSAKRSANNKRNNENSPTSSEASSKRAVSSNDEPLRRRDVVSAGGCEQQPKSKADSGVRAKNRCLHRRGELSLGFGSLGDSHGCHTCFS
jgi:hypothetical protein